MAKLELDIEFFEYLNKLLIVDEEKNFNRLDKNMDDSESLYININIDRIIRSKIDEIIKGERKIKDNSDMKIGFRVADREQ